MSPFLHRLHTRSEWQAWGVFVLAFAVVVSTLLVRSHGLPYGLDNNESFSNITHARAIANYGVTQSVGLTDETAATHPGASPYIHSHQGNFPRFFATLIYFLGARSIEAQIALTTFTVGLSAFWFAFAYLARRTNAVFALLACLVLLADYLLVLQWHVNSYRVWHAWFFFAILWFVDRGDQPRGHLWTVLGILLFAALFYWEYVFGFFLGLLAALYACLVHWRSPGRWLRLWGMEVAGGAVAVICLLTQLTLFMGWSNVLLDIQYTLQARNSLETQALNQRIPDFYDKHHVLFWPNYADASSLRHVSRLVDSFLQDHLKYYTPPLVLLMVWVMGGWLVGLLPDLWGRNAIWPARLPPAVTGAAKWLLVCGLGYLLARPYVRKEAWAGALLALAIIGIFSLVARALRTTGFRWSELSLLRFAGFGLLLAGIQQFVSAPLVHAGMFAGIWDQATGVTGLVLIAVTLGGLILAALLGVTGASRLLGSTSRENLSGLVPLFAATLVGYVGTYWIFTGYIFSGYLYRQAPFLVFVTDLALALVIYLAGRIGWLAASALPVGGADASAADPEGQIVRDMPALAGVALALIVGGGACFGWLQVHRHYTRLVPADRHGYLQDLAKHPFKGRSFAVTTYASPVSVQTGSWAMMEPVLFTGRVALTPRGFEVPRENTYKWFADRETNPAYLKPDFALFQRSTGWSDVAAADQAGPDRPESGPNLRTVGLIGRASLPFTMFLHPKIAAMDESPAQSFAIVAMDWDYPAYLTELAPAVSPLSRWGRASVAALATSGEADWHIRLKVSRLKPGQQITLRRIQTPQQTVDLPAIPVKSPAWVAVPGSDVVRTSAFPAVLSVEAHGTTLDLEFEKGQDGGLVHVRVNEVEAVLDLHAEQPGTATYHFSSRNGEDGLVTLPRTAPGQFAAVEIRNRTATLTYDYRHQEGSPEMQTLINLYQQDDAGLWRLRRDYMLLGRELRPVDLRRLEQENPDTLDAYRRAVAQGDQRNFPTWLAEQVAAHPEQGAQNGLQPASVRAEAATGETHGIQLELPADLSGTFRLGIMPGTGRKLGPEYFSNAFIMAEPETPFGPLVMRLRLAGSTGPERQPLLTSGSGSAGSLVFIQYVAPDRISLGVDAGTQGILISPPFAIDPHAEQIVEISHGSLYPLPGHPRMQALDEDLQVSLRRFVRVVWNNEPVIEADMPLPPINPRAVKLGESAGFPGTAHRLAGEILSAERRWPESFVPYAHLSQIQTTLFGPLSLEVRFPTGLAGRSEPLVTSGVTGAGNFLYVQYIDDRHIRLGYDHWGVKGFLGEPVEIEPERWYRLTVSMGSLYPPEGDLWFSEHGPAAAQEAKHQVRVFLDDRPVFAARAPAYESPPRFVTTGANTIGGSTTGPIFSGTIREMKRLPLMEFPLATPPR